MRIRHFGFLANRCRAERLTQIRVAIDAEQNTPAEAPGEPEGVPFDGYPCSRCRQGRRRVIARLAPIRYDGG